MINKLAQAFSLTLVLSGIAAAAEGDLDTSFGTNGIALTGLSDAGGGVSECKPVVQPDGKIVICGTRNTNGSSGSDFFVARFTADGQLDSTFSFDGKTTIDFDSGAGADGALGLALQADGRIVVVGASKPTPTGTTDFAIARLLADGTLDPSFGAGTGKKLIAFDLNAGDGNDSATDVAIQADGKIVVVGSVDTTSDGTDFGIVRLLPDGTPDASFNLSGKVTVGFNIAGGTFNDDARRVAIDSAGRIVVGGSANAGTVAGLDFAVVRLLPNGQLDANFDADGRATVAFNVGATGTDQLLGMTIQHDGKILLSGSVDVAPSGSPNPDFGIARLQQDGSPDTTFGFLGKTLVAFDLVPGGQDLPIGIAEQANGKIDVVGAAQYTSGLLSAALLQLNADGSADTSFGTQGKRTYDFGLTVPGSQAFLNIGFQGTQILASGIAIIDGISGVDNFVARLQTDLIFANGFD